MFYIILDSNIIYNNWFFDKANFAKLVDFAKYAPLNIILPETVLDEIKTKYAEGFKRHKDRLDFALDDLQMYLNPEFVVEAGVQYKNVDKVDIAEMYGNFMLGRIRDLHNFLILPYPKIKPKEIIARALLQKKPFKATSKSGQTGFRDFIVWMSIIDLLRVSQMGTFIFITQNKSDYFDEDGHDLDEDILADLAAVNMTNKEFFIFNSLSEFYSQYEDIVMRFVSEKVAMQDFKGALAHAEAEINERDDFAFLIKKSIRDTYKSWIPDIEPKYLNLSYSPVIRKPITVKNLTDIVVAERYKVTTFDFNTFYIRGRFKVKLDLVYEVDRSDYWKSHKYDNTIPEPQIVANRDNYYLNHNLFLWMDAEIKYEKGSHKILSIEAKFIPEPKQSAGSFGPANSNQGGQMVMAAGGAKAPTSTPAADKDQGFYLEASGGGAKKPLDGSEEDYELNDTVIFNKISKR